MVEMKQWVEKLKYRSYFFVKEHLAFFLFVILLLLLGVIFGAVAVGQLGEAQRHDLKTYLQSFFGMMGEGSFASPSDIFQVSLWNHLKMVGLIWILGISIVGCPLIIFFLFLKGMMLGFSIGLLVSEFGLQGFLLSAGTIFPQNIIIIPLWIWMVTMSLSFSMDFLKYLIAHKKIQLGKKFMKYSMNFVGIGVMFFLPALYEAFMSPHIMTYLVEQFLP